MLCFLVSFSGNAQHVRLESKEELKAKVLLLSDLEAQKIELLCGLAYKNRYDSSKVGISYAQQALKIARLQKNKIGEIQAYCQLLRLCAIKKNPIEARKHEEKGLSILPQIKDLYWQSQFYAALHFFHVRQVTSQNKALLRSFEIIKKIDSSAAKYQYLKINHLNNIAEYLRTSTPKKAIPYLKKALAIGKELTTPPVSLARTYNRLGACFLAFGDKVNQQKALQYHQEALKVCTQLLKQYPNHSKLLEVKANSWNEMALIYRMWQQQDSSFYYSWKSIALRKKLGVPSLIEAYILLSGSYRAYQQPQKAIYLLDSALHLTKQEGYLASIHASLATTYRAMGQYKKEGQHWEKTLHYVATKSESTFKAATQEFTAKYETDLKDKEIQIAHTENQAQRQEIEQKKLLNLLFELGVLLMLLFVLYVVYVNRQTKNKNQLLSNQKEEIASQAEELQVINDRLLELSQFKTDLSSMLVHDLKNPLNTIIGLTLGGLVDKNQQTSIHQAGKSMLSIVNNMLDVHRLEEAELSPVLQVCQLSQLVNEAVDHVLFMAQQKEVVLQPSATDDFWVKADPALMLRVFTNLLTNAIKHSPAQTKVQIHAQATENQQVEVCVKDEGVGIQLEKQQIIFEKFKGENAAYSQGSTGLGLTFVALAVGVQGGTVSVASEKNKGATFSVTITKATPQDQPKAAANHSEQPPAVASSRQNLPEVVIQCIQALENTEIYEASKILKVLQNIDETASPEALAWKDEVTQAMYGYSEKKFQQLIKLPQG